MTASLLQSTLGSAMGGGLTIIDVFGAFSRMIGTMFFSGLGLYGGSTNYGLGLYVTYYGNNLRKYELQNGTWSELT